MMPLKAWMEVKTTFYMYRILISKLYIYTLLKNSNDANKWNLLNKYGEAVVFLAYTKL